MTIDEEYILQETEGISSLIFHKDRKIFKLNRRNSVEREESDYQTLTTKFPKFIGHFPETEISKAIYKNKKYTCVAQPIILGKEVKYLSTKQLHNAIKNNKDFLLGLLDFFFNAIENCQLYPDLVGYPKDPAFFNSINLILENKTGKLILCDVGLSPHEDTLQKFGNNFYYSDNIKTYLGKMSEFKKQIESL